MSTALSPLAHEIINRYQKGFPRTSTPFATIANDLGVCEADVIATVRDLNASGVLSRIGGVIRRGRVGASTLAAMAVPPERLEEVAALVNSYEEVNHNYERENEMNLWFVVVAPDLSNLERVLDDIRQRTGLDVEDLRLTKAHHIDLGFRI